jgi:ParB-like chromosome segregation protein Spo0J
MSAARVKLLRSSSAQVEMRTLADLKPYPGNARTHSARQVKQIARSMRQWGFTIPILIDEDDMILAGHGRKLAAERLKLDEAPCLVARGWSDAQKKAYVIADNKLAENARWDDDLLIAEITALREEDPTIDLVIGFDERELDKLAEDIAERAAPKLKGLNYSIVVRCEGERQQRELLAAFEEQGLKCEALIA